MKLPAILEEISLTLYSKGAKAIVVGGAVRDHFLKLPIKDYDIEVYGLNQVEELESVLSSFGHVSAVGKSFGVLKLHLKEEAYDFSFPRTERQSGIGHKAFDVSCDGSLRFEEASRRRDFTINAMGYDIVTRVFLDPFNAQEDMKNKILRHVDHVTFIEDPLRVYRAVQFAARFRFRLSEETFKICKEMVEKGMLETLPKERIYMEWKKLLLKAPKPSQGFELMRELGILRYFPELEALVGTEESSDHHLEGDAWMYTMLSLDAMAQQIARSREQREEIDDKQALKYMFAILCLDLGKPLTTKIIDGRVKAIGYEKAGLEPTKKLLYRLMDEHDFINTLLPLVEHHLKPLQLYQEGAKAGAIKRLATKVNIEELVRVARAYFSGHMSEEGDSDVFKAGDWLLTQAKELNVVNTPIENLLQGRDLIALGLEPSPAFTEILNEVYEKQMDGEFRNKEEALAYVRYNYITNT
ncbi:MAG: hypothetical protein ABXS92_00670 [Sulfurimonas sp.]